MTDKRSAYRDAGVDIDAQAEALAEVKKLARATFTPGVLSEIGLFGGLFRPDLAGLEEPVLVASADGVGTKLAVAKLAGDFSTVGRDLVNHCVNDILVQGARPLFFLDYVGAGVLEPPKLVELVRGVADGCRENGCALLGGETAEMPGFYQPGDYELVGFIVGVVDRTRVLDGSRVVRRATCSSGCRRRACTPTATRWRAGSCSTELGLVAARPAPGREAGEGHASASGFCAAPLLPRGARRRCSAHPALHALAHITGGGLTDNLPRVLPEGLAGGDPARQLGDPRAVPYPPGRGRRRARGDVPRLQHGRSAWCSSWRPRRLARSRRPWRAPASARAVDRHDPDGRRGVVYDLGLTDAEDVALR